VSDRLIEIKALRTKAGAGWSRNDALSADAVDWLVSEVERLRRFEAMWEDCRRHRKQVEGRAARYREIVQGVANLLIANEEASPP
jgi:hypothetical protein